jgi:hypothetical protein
MKPRIALLLVLLAAAIAGSLAVRHRSREGPTTAPALDTRGWWVIAARDADPVAGEDIARQLSLPYAAGVVRPSEDRFGVRAWDRQRAQPGWNLYVSGHDLEAVLTAMDGRVLHRWRTRFADAFPGRTATADSGFFRRARLLRDGGLLALVQGAGLLRLDRDSRIVWRYDAPLFNDVEVSADGERIRVIAKEAVERPRIRAGEPVLEDFLVTLDAGGRELDRASLLDALERFAGAEVLRPLGPSADLLHTNTVRTLDSATAGPFGGGRVLLSFREIDTLALFDPGTATMVWAKRGPWRGQHEPSLESDGRLLLFDNLGGPGATSRVLRFDPATGAIDWQWSGFDGRPLRSRQAGAVHRLGNGNLLVVESERGAAYELDAAGRVVWEFASPHRAGDRRELVAVLFDVVRLERATPFLASLPAQAP